MTCPQFLLEQVKVEASKRLFHQLGQKMNQFKKKEENKKGVFFVVLVFFTIFAVQS